MTTINQIYRIWTYFYEKGKNLSEIATLMNLDWLTARKYVEIKGFNLDLPVPVKEVQHTVKLNKKVLDVCNLDSRRRCQLQKYLFHAWQAGLSCVQHLLKALAECTVYQDGVCSIKKHVVSAVKLIRFRIYTVTLAENTGFKTNFSYYYSSVVNKMMTLVSEREWLR